MATTEKYLPGGTYGTLITGAEMGSLASGSLAIGATPYINAQNAGTVDATHGDGATLCDVEAKLVFGTAPADNTGFPLWFLALTSDGATYEDGSASITPARAPDAVFPLKNANGTTQLVNRRVLLPWGTFKGLTKNDGTGQALTGTTSYIKIRPVQTQGV